MQERPRRGPRGVQGYSCRRHGHKLGILRAALDSAIRPGKRGSDDGVSQGCGNGSEEMKPGRPAHLQRRRKKFFKQGEFADLLGITFEHLSRVETGKAIFSPGTRKLAEAILTWKEAETVPYQIEALEKILFDI